MRIITVVLALILVPGFSHGNNEDGEYCLIPKLEQGVATTIDVPYIDKPFCGTALIDKHFVRMSEFAQATDEGEPQCSSETFCTKVFRFYRDEERATKPYILIFHGPRHRKSG